MELNPILRRVYWGKETFLDILGYETLRNQLRHSFHKLWIPMDNPSNHGADLCSQRNNETETKETPPSDARIIKRVGPPIL